jgi:hypothetical protein
MAQVNQEFAEAPGRPEIDEVGDDLSPNSHLAR